MLLLLASIAMAKVELNGTVLTVTYSAENPGTVMETDVQMFADMVTEVIFGENVFIIAQFAFTDFRVLKSVVFNSSLLAMIAHNAFTYCPIESLVLPGMLQVMDYNCFASCTCLRTADLSALVLTAVPDGTFYGCSNLSEVLLPAQLNQIGESAFGFCGSLARVDLRADLKSIGVGAFEGCTSLREFVVPEAVTLLPELVFRASGLESINLSSVEVVRGRAFAECRALVSVVFGSRLTNVSSGAFEDSALASVVLPPSVVMLGSLGFAFAPFAYLELSSVPDIAPKVFFGCSEVRKICFHGMPSDADCAALRDLLLLPNVTVDSSVPDFCVPPASPRPSQSA